MMTVDTHAHVFLRTNPMLDKARYKPDYDAVLEDWTACWPRAGVTHGVLVQPSFLGTDNSYMLEQMRRDPKHLRGVMVVDPSISETELREADAIGVRGIRLNLIGITEFHAFSEQPWQALFDRIMRQGWHLEVQCLGELWPSLLSELGGIPVPLVVDHFGLPDPGSQGSCPGVDAIIRESAKRRVYIKLSAPYRLRGADARHYAMRYLSALGSDNLLWGSDWPWTNHEPGRDYAQCRDWLNQWIPSESQRSRILDAAALQLYGFSTSR